MTSLPYSRDIFNEVKHISFFDVLQRYLPDATTRRVGSRLMMRCCFHEDSTPSFTAYADGFKCWGCGAHGDATDFVGRLMNIKLIDAARLIARDFGIEVDDRPLTPEVRQKIAEVKQEAVINNNFEADMKRLYSEISLIRRCAWQCGFEALTYYCDNILDSMYDKSTEAKIAAWRLAQHVLGEVI